MQKGLGYWLRWIAALPGALNKSQQAPDEDLAILDEEIANQQAEIARIDQNILRLKTELVENRIEAERSIHALTSGNESEDFLPSFTTWIQLPEIQKMNIEEALDSYIGEYDLLKPSASDEPIELSKDVTRLAVLEVSKDKFMPDFRVKLDEYIFSLRICIDMQRTGWKMRKQSEALDKALEGKINRLKENPPAPPI